MVSLVLAAWACRAAAQDDLAMLSYMKGDVQIRRNGASAFAPAEQEMALQVGDTVRTGPDSRARIVTEDDNTLILTQNSVLTIGRAESNYEDDSQNSDFNLDSGKVRAIVTKLATSNSSFQIKTPTAVAGVRGTDYVVEVDPDTEESAVTVLDGGVDVEDRLGRVGNKIALDKEQELRFSRRNAPGRPRRLSPERVKELRDKLALAIEEKMPGADPETIDRMTSAVLALRRSPLPDAMKNRIVTMIKNDKLPPFMVRHVLRMSHRGVPPTAIFKMLNYVRNHSQDPDVQQFYQSLKQAKSPAEAKHVFQEFKEHAVEKAKEQKDEGAEPQGE